MKIKMMMKNIILMSYYKKKSEIMFMSMMMTINDIERMIFQTLRKYRIK